MSGSKVGLTLVALTVGGVICVHLSVVGSVRFIWMVKLIPWKL